MKTKIALALVIVAVAVPFAMAKQPNPGSLGPPEDFLVTQNDDSIFFSWLPVEGATKYSVAVCGKITYSDGNSRDVVPFKWDFGTDDEIGSVYMRSGRVVLEIPKPLMKRLVLAILQDAGVDRATVVGFLLEAEAKVKAMNPGKGAGPQNNPWSNTDDFDFRWVRPAPV